MAKTALNTAEANTQELSATEGSIDQIREILFGTVQREHEARAAGIEKLIQRHAKDAADSLAKVQATLERRLEQTQSEVEARLDRLSEQLGQAEETARQDNAAAARELSEKITGLDKRLTQDLDAQEGSLREALAMLNDELSAAVRRLEEEKTGNANLGDWLMELGMRLKGDSTLTTIESSLGGALRAKPDEKA